MIFIEKLVFKTRAAGLFICFFGGYRGNVVKNNKTTLIKRVFDQSESPQSPIYIIT